MVDAGKLKQVILSALVTAAVVGIGSLIATIADQANMTTIQGIILTAIVTGLKVVQKWIAVSGQD